jgi:hypothetical protein
MELHSGYYSRSRSFTGNPSGNTGLAKSGQRFRLILDALPEIDRRGCGRSRTRSAVRQPPAEDRQLPPHGYRQRAGHLCELARLRSPQDRGERIFTGRINLALKFRVVGNAEAIWAKNQSIGNCSGVAFCARGFSKVGGHSGSNWAIRFSQWGYPPASRFLRLNLKSESNLCTLT